MSGIEGNMTKNFGKILERCYYVRKAWRVFIKYETTRHN